MKVYPINEWKDKIEKNIKLNRKHVNEIEKINKIKA